MNYLNLINKCLVELNYKQVNTFSELTKNDHKKIKNLLNLVNTEVCRMGKWNFLLKKHVFKLPKNMNEIENPILGRITLLLVDGVKYEYCSDFKMFLAGHSPMNTYSQFNDKLLFQKFNEEKTIEAVYYANSNAIDIAGNYKNLLENEDDMSLIPEAFAEPILVYGTCARHKASPKHVKFAYWLSMYKDAIANLRTKDSVNIDESPQIKLFRN